MYDNIMFRRRPLEGTSHGKKSGPDLPVGGDMTISANNS